MGSKEQKKALLNQKLEQLGSITNSPSVNKTSIVAHASKYIEELKERIDKLNEDVSTSQPSHDDDQHSLPAVTVETLEKGFIINVFSAKNCPGLLVSILEAFEELDLELSDARVSCSDSFRLEAVSDAFTSHDGVFGQDPYHIDLITKNIQGGGYTKTSTKEQGFPVIAQSDFSIISLLERIVYATLLEQKNEGQIECVDAQMVKQAVLEAIRNWSKSKEQD